MVATSRLTVAVAQSIPVPGDLARSVESHVVLASLAAEHGAQLVLFPELSLTGYDLGLTRDDAVDVSDPRLGPLLVIVVGAPVASSDGLHIGAMSFVPRAEVMTYLKEYPHHSEEVAFVRGAGGDLLDVSEQNVALAICADLTHPEHAHAAVQRGATIYAASCFLTESGYTKDADLLKRYATDYGIVVIMANYGAPMGQWSAAGKSTIWSSDGSLIACAPHTGPALVVAEQSSDGWTGYVVEIPGSVPTEI